MIFMDYIDSKPHFMLYYDYKAFWLFSKPLGISFVAGSRGFFYVYYCFG